MLEKALYKVPHEAPDNVEFSDDESEEEDIRQQTGSDDHF